MLEIRAELATILDGFGDANPKNRI